MGYAVTPRGVESIETVSPHFSGTLAPESAGLLGGYPGSVNRVVLHQSAGVSDSYAKGRVPADPSALLSEPEILPGVARMALNSDDVLEVATSGGGGWGDAIEREPDRVASDVRGGLVSVDDARALFGVELDGEGEPHASATAARRQEILRARAAQINATDAPQTSHRHESPAHAPQEPAAGWPTVTIPLSDSGPAAQFSLARSYCPECLGLVRVERQLTEARGIAR